MTLQELALEFTEPLEADICIRCPFEHLSRSALWEGRDYEHLRVHLRKIALLAALKRLVSVNHWAEKVAIVACVLGAVQLCFSVESSCLPAKSCRTRSRKFGTR